MGRRTFRIQTQRCKREANHPRCPALILPGSKDIIVDLTLVRKDKFKLNMPFNNERDKITQVIDDLKNAADEVINSTIPVDPNSISKKKLELPKI